jgi:hypothetical protein
VFPESAFFTSWGVLHESPSFISYRRSGRDYGGMRQQDHEHYDGSTVTVRSQRLRGSVNGDLERPSGHHDVGGGYR